MSTTTPATATSIRIYTHDDAPNPSAIEAQVAEQVAAQGMTIELVNATNDPSLAIKAGVVGLPAIVVHAGADEIARRECAVAGRRLGRWLDRKVLSGTSAPALAPAFA